MDWPKNIIEIEALVGPPGSGWVDVTKAMVKSWPRTEQIAITYRSDAGLSTLYTNWRPPRRRDENPIQYRKRTGCVDDNYLRRHQGWYYCNPAHCKRRWRNKAERDKHAGIAYAILG
jgi:hypothetical protein